MQATSITSTPFQYSHAPREKEGVDFWWLDWQQYPNSRAQEHDAQR